MTAAPVLPDQLMREADHTLALLDEIRSKTRRDEVPGWIWLRAARACWLTATMELARENYKRAAVALVELALDAGRRTGTVEQYGALALGAAWMTEERDVLSDTARQIDGYCEHQLSSLDNPPEPLIRVGLILTRMRAAWYRGQKTPLKDLGAELERRLNQLDAFGKAFWLAERGGPTSGFFKAYATVKPDPMKAAIQELDRFLDSERAKPPTITDLVDEEFISFAAAMNDMQIELPALRTPAVPGGVAAES